jgi:BirA family biotin operon repressor/biotin-[acetyl-CoA-carboxylase] ligase
MQSAAATISGIRLVTHDSVGSTNAEAFALARRGMRESTWVTAWRQTAGRGRRGRGWESPPGNLYASLLLVDACEAAVAPQLSFVAGLALHDAVVESALLLALRLKLKWPNDLLLDDRKCAGILIEGERLSDATFAVVIGIGVNCTSSPQEAAYPATSLAEAGADVAPRDLLDRLGRDLIQRLGQWQRGEGFAEIRADWLARTWKIGEPVRLRTPEEIEGRFAGVDAHGRLLIEVAEGTVRTIAAGDIAPAAGEVET